MSELVEKVAMALAPCPRVEGWGRCDAVCPACDELARAAIKAVAEWLAQSEDRECNPLQALAAARNAQCGFSPNHTGGEVMSEYDELLKELELVPSPVRNAAGLAIEALVKARAECERQYQAKVEEVVAQMNRAEAAESERDRLAGEVERWKAERDAAITDRFNAAADRIKAVAAERDRLKAALETVRQYVKGGPDHVSDDDITAVFSVVDAALRAAGDGR